MLIAVSNLSPVKTQSFILADNIAWIVSPTLSYNLSSIAVAAITIRFYSSSFCSLAIYSSLSSSEVVAYKYFLFHYSNSYYFIYLYATNKVLSPS